MSDLDDVYDVCVYMYRHTSVCIHMPLPKSQLSNEFAWGKLQDLMKTSVSKGIHSERTLGRFFCASCKPG